MPTEYFPKPSRRQASNESTNTREGRPLVPPSPGAERPSRSSTRSSTRSRPASPAGPRPQPQHGFLSRSANQVRQRAVSGSPLRRAGAPAVPLDGTRHVSYQYGSVSPTSGTFSVRSMPTAPRATPPGLSAGGHRTHGRSASFGGVGLGSAFPASQQRAAQRDVSEGTYIGNNGRTPAGLPVPGEVRPRPSFGASTRAMSNHTQVNQAVRRAESGATAPSRQVPLPSPSYPNIGRSGYDGTRVPATRNLAPGVDNSRRSLEQAMPQQQFPGSATVSRSSSSASGASSRQTGTITFQNMPAYPAEPTPSSAVAQSTHGGHARKTSYGKYLDVPRVDFPGVTRTLSSGRPRSADTRASGPDTRPTLPFPHAQSASVRRQTSQSLAARGRTLSTRRPIPSPGRVPVARSRSQSRAPGPAPRQQPSNESLGHASSSSHSSSDVGTEESVRPRSLLMRQQELGIPLDEALVQCLLDDPDFVRGLAQGSGRGTPAPSGLTSGTESEDGLPQTPQDQVAPARPWDRDEDGHEDPQKTPTAVRHYPQVDTPALKTGRILSGARVDKSLPPTPETTSPPRKMQAPGSEKLEASLEKQPQAPLLTKASPGPATSAYRDDYILRELQENNLADLVPVGDIGVTVDKVTAAYTLRCNFNTDGKICGCHIKDQDDFKVHRFNVHGIAPDSTAVCESCGMDFTNRLWAKPLHVRNCNREGSHPSDDGTSALSRISSLKRLLKRERSPQ